MPRLATRLAEARQRPLVRDAIERGIEARLIDTGLALASRLFVAVIPLALLVTALLPDGETFAERLVSGLHLHGEGRAAAEQLFAAPDRVWAGMTIATVVVIAYSVQSCGGVLQRMYIAAWRLGTPGAGRFWTDMRARAVWAVGFMVYVLATFARPDDAGAWWSTLLLRDVAGTAVAVAFYTWTPYVLLSRRVPARRLLPTALIGAVALGTVTAVAPLYVSRLASTSAERYGLVGFAFAFLTWLFAQAVLIAAAAVVGAAIGDRSRPHPPHPFRNAPITDPEPVPPSISA
jgi:membrane protein